MNRRLIATVMLFASAAALVSPATAAEEQTAELTAEVVFGNGNRLQGTLASFNDSHLVLLPELRAGTRMQVETPRVRRIRLGEQGQEKKAAERLETRSAIHLTDGSLLRGHILRLEPDTLHVQVEELGRLKLPLSHVAQVRRSDAAPVFAIDRAPDWSAVGLSANGRMYGRATVTGADALQVQRKDLTARVSFASVGTWRRPPTAPPAIDAEKPLYAVLLRRSRSCLLLFDTSIRDDRFEAQSPVLGAVALPPAELAEIRCSAAPLSNGNLRGNTLLAYGYNNRIVELDPDGEVLWDCVAKAVWSAEALDNGNVLAACYDSGTVRELGRDGRIVWEHKGTGCVHVRPLPNGNVLAAGYASHDAREINRDGEIVWRYRTRVHCTDAQRLPNGHTLVAAGSKLQEVTPKGDVVWEWGGGQDIYAVQVLPASRLLVADFHRDLVLEIDAEGNVLWELEEKGVCDVQRLPNGNTLTASASRFAEFDPVGALVWERKGCSYGTIRR